MQLQFLGPAALFAFILAGEGAAWALGRAPTWEILWYLNLEIFPVLRKSYYIPSVLAEIPHFQLYFIAMPLFALACGGLAVARALPVAIASNLSFIYASFMAYCLATASPRLQAASLGGVSVSTISLPSGPCVYLVIVLVLTSLASFAISHFCYFREIAQQK
jgi:hypothetical protein